ncbi:MAG: hypothetical protein QOJ19_4693 [Acidimicrobiia bacterium]|nr:hypothetical protein [Acidimicrobiia bacterium]
MAEAPFATFDGALLAVRLTAHLVFRHTDATDEKR